MTLDEVIERYTTNAEYERIHGNLQGCLEFRQLVKWLKELKENKGVLDKIVTEIKGIEYLGCPQPHVVLNDVLQIINKYKAESVQQKGDKNDRN